MVDMKNRGGKTGHVQRPAFLEEAGLDLTDRSSPEVQELTQMLGGAAPIEEIDVHSDSLDEADQIEAAIIALRNETPVRPTRDDTEADAAVAHVLRSTAQREGGNQNRLSVVAAIRAEQESEDADDDDDPSDAGLDLREKSEEEIAKIGKLSDQTKKVLAERQGQHVVRPKGERTAGASSRPTAKLYSDKPVQSVPKEPIRGPEPEDVPDEEPLEEPQEVPTPEPPAKPEPPQMVFVPPKPTVTVEGAGGSVSGVGGGKGGYPGITIGPKTEVPSPRPQVLAERKLAREAGVKTEAKIEQQHQPTEDLQSLLAQIEADDDLPQETPEPFVGRGETIITGPHANVKELPAPTDKLLFTTVIPKFERTLTQTYGGTRIEFWASGKITVSGQATGPQLRAMLLTELNLQDE